MTAVFEACGSSCESPVLRIVCVFIFSSPLRNADCDPCAVMKAFLEEGQENGEDTPRNEIDGGKSDGGASLSEDDEQGGCDDVGGGGGSKGKHGGSKLWELNKVRGCRVQHTLGNRIVWYAYLRCVSSLSCDL